MSEQDRSPNIMGPPADTKIDTDSPLNIDWATYNQSKQNNDTVVDNSEVIDSPPTIERLNDPAFLPSIADLKAIFSNNPDNSLAAYLLNEESPVFEVLTQEYIDGLSNYLIKRATELDTVSSRPLRVLEVGAGNGRLTHFLKQAVATKAQIDLDLTATDSGSWQIPPAFEVTQLPQDDALILFQPDIVIASWMPYKADWTPEFRNTSTVQEYILIGESHGGNCGSDATWGCAPLDDDYYPIEGYIPEFEQDGFDLEFVDVASEQLCRTDYDIPGYHSHTASFKRRLTQ